MNSLWTITKESWERIDRSGRRTLYLYGLALVVISALDGLGLILLSKLTESTSQNMLEGKGLLGGAVIGLFVARSVLAGGITWLGYSVFAKQEVRIGQENFSSYQSMSWEIRASDQLSEIYSVVDRGPFALTQQFLLPIATTLAEVANALVVFLVLLFLDPVTAIATASFFGIVVVIQHRVLSLTMSKSGQAVANEMNSTYNILSDSFHLGKVLQVMPSKSLELKLDQTRTSLAHARSKTLFLESLPRYLMESMLALGIVVIGLVTTFVRGSEHLLASLSIFGVAGFRLLPIVNRIQGLILGLIGRESLVQLALRDLPSTSKDSCAEDALTSYVDDKVILRIRDVCYTYPSNQKSTLENISIDFIEGRQYAIVGPSGSGKTTLIDICMEILNPQAGQVIWNHKKSPSIGYVPQDSTIIGCSVVGNVSLEWDENYADKNLSKEALLGASLSFLKEDKRFDDRERMNTLSGGQRQRLGLARALYRKSTVMFLDEPTSALDATTEHEIMESIEKLRGTTTVVIVAHRLSTIRHADEVIYLEDGKILGIGSFEQLRKNLPQFAEQIELGKILED